MTEHLTSDDEPSVMGGARDLPPMPTQEEFRAAHKRQYVRLFVAVGVPEETACEWHDEQWEELKDRTPEECFSDETSYWEQE